MDLAEYFRRIVGDEVTSRKYLYSLSRRASLLERLPEYSCIPKPEIAAHDLPVPFIDSPLPLGIVKGLEDSAVEMYLGQRRHNDLALLYQPLARLRRNPIYQGPPAVSWQLARRRCIAAIKRCLLPVPLP